VERAKEGEEMTKAAFNALITEFSIDTDHFPGTDLVQKEGHVGLAIISDPAGDLWKLFIDKKPVKVQIVDKDSDFDFTERKVKRERVFNVRLENGSFQCFVSVNYHINGIFHHSRNTTYTYLSNCTIQRLYNPKKAIDLFEKNFGFCIHSNTERTDLLPMRKQFDKEKVRRLFDGIMSDRFLAGCCKAYNNHSAYRNHSDKAEEDFKELLSLLDMEDK